MGPTNRLWKARVALLGRMIKYIGTSIGTAFASLAKGFQQFCARTDFALFPLALMFFVIVFMLNLMVKENRGRKPATAAMVTEYRAKNECLRDLIPKIAEDNNGAPLLVSQIWKANDDCAKAIADLAEKQALEKALAK